MRQRRPAGNPFVWVVGSEADYPGIVVDRRRVGAGWQIHVAYTSPRHELMQQWLDAEQLLPYESPRGASAGVVRKPARGADPAGDRRLFARSVG